MQTRSILQAFRQFAYAFMPWFRNDIHILILREASRLIDEVGWTKGTYVKDANGDGEIEITSPNVVAYCALGAIRAATASLLGNEYHIARYQCEAEAGTTVGDNSIGLWNDYTAHDKYEVAWAMEKTANRLAGRN